MSILITNGKRKILNIFKLILNLVRDQGFTTPTWVEIYPAKDSINNSHRELVTKPNCTETNSVCNWNACFRSADTLPLSLFRHNSCYSTHSMLSLFCCVYVVSFKRISFNVITFPNASDPLYEYDVYERRIQQSQQNMDRET